MWLLLNPDEVKPGEGFTRNIRSIGHNGTGDLKLTIRYLDDLERNKLLIRKSFEEN